MTTKPHLADHQPTHPDDTPDNHTTEGACFACWCYGCGERTDNGADHAPCFS